MFSNKKANSILEGLYVSRIDEGVLDSKSKIESAMKKLLKKNIRDSIREWEKFFQDVPVASLFRFTTVFSNGNSYTVEVIKTKSFNPKSSTDKIWYDLTNKRYQGNYDATAWRMYNDDFSLVELLDCRGVLASKYLSQLGLDINGARVGVTYKGTDLGMRIASELDNNDWSVSDNYAIMGTVGDILKEVPVGSCLAYTNRDKVTVLHNLGTKWEYKLLGGDIAHNLRSMVAYGIAEQLVDFYQKGTLDVDSIKIMDFDKANLEYSFEYDGKTSFNLTAWSSSEGTIRIINDKNSNGFYLDINNKYDKTVKTSAELIKYLRSVEAKFVGYESANDW